MAIRTEVTPMWYQYGQIIGVPEDTLVNCSSYPPSECIIEVLDYWLRNNLTPLTWSDVATTLREMDLHQLANTVELM